MDSQNDHAHILVNPFPTYIGLGLCAAILQRFLPLPFIEQFSARVVGMMIMIANLPIGLTALRNMFTAKTSPNPYHSTTSLVLSGPYRFTRNPMYIGLTLLYAGLGTFLQLA